MHVVAPKGVSTCRSKGPEDVWIERTYDYVVASGSLKGKILLMEVVEDFESRAHKTVTFVVRREKEMKELNEQKLPKVLLGYSGGRLPGRSTKEKGRERRIGRRGQRQKKDQGSKCPRSGCRHQREGKWA